VARIYSGISYAAQTDLLARGWITLQTILVALQGQPGIGARVPAWRITESAGNKTRPHGAPRVRLGRFRGWRLLRRFRMLPVCGALGHDVVLARALLFQECPGWTWTMMRRIPVVGRRVPNCCARKRHMLASWPGKCRAMKPLNV
jgi:hypothetical protein